ncbi:MAG: translation initiation factor IF-2, partial [Litorivivens sp.]
MSSTTTVAEFAAELNKSTATLIEQLTSAGVAKAQAGDHLSEADKQKLLSYLQASHGTVSAERKKITLVKKSTTEIKQADSTGRARTIQVEVRKKRTFVKREDGSDVAVDDVDVAASQEPVADNTELYRLQQEASQKAEQLLRQEEEEFAEKCRLRDAQEAQEAAREQERLAAELSAQAAAKAAQAAEAQKAAKASAVKPVIGSRVFPDQSVVNAEAAAAAAVAAEAAAAVQAAKAAEISAAQAAVKAKATAEFQADAAKVQDFQDRRKKAEAEAAGIRAMMNAPKRVLVPHVDPKIAMRGTLHKPAVVPGAVKPGAPVVAGV